MAREISRINGKFGLQLHEINIGGGLGVKYTEEDVPPSTFEIAELIVNKLNEKYPLKEVDLDFVSGPEIKIIEDNLIIGYKCDCTKEKFERGLISLGKKEIVVIAEQGYTNLIIEAAREAGIEIQPKAKKKDIANLLEPYKYDTKGYHIIFIAQN